MSTDPRYQVKYIGFSIHAVIDTKAPAGVCGDTSQGHLLLWCLNGSWPCQIAADALNALDKYEDPPIEGKELSDEAMRQFAENKRIADKAVRKAIEENRAKGIPDES